MSQYKTIATIPAGAPTVTAVVPPVAHAEPNRKPGEPAKAEHTTEMVKEKIEPGRDIFANPIQNNEVKAETSNTVDPAALEEERKAKEEKMRSEIERLKNKVGPLSPSEAIAKAAIEQAEFDAIVKDPSKDDSKPKEDEKKAETTVLEKEEKTMEKVEEKVEEKAEEKAEKKAEEKAEEKKTETEKKPKSEGTHDKEVKDGSVSSIQPAPSSGHDVKDEKEKTPLSPEEIEAERVRQVLYGKEG